MNLKFFLALVCAVSFSGVMAQDPDSDFAARCSGAGVVKCVGFDNTTADIVLGDNLHPDGDGVQRAFLDTNTRASGAGSLRFDLPPPPHAGGNIGGSWSPTSNDGLGGLEFGQNSTFHVQYRQRVTQSMLNNSWNSTWKTVIFHANQITCGGIELTTMNRYLSGIMVMYTGCGTPSMYTTLDGSSHTENTPLLLQQGNFNCQYGQTSTETCFYFPANEWVTFYYKFSIGDWDQPNSVIEAWIAREGSSQYQQFIRVPNMTLSCNTDPCSSPPGSNQAYNNLTITPYMTSLSRNSGDAGVTANTWYDELIVSTQPIPAPSSGPRAKSPTSLNSD